MALSDKARLANIARRAMIEQGLQPDFPPQALAELEAMKGAAFPEKAAVDLTNLLWCSIDNDDSRDLDQLTVAEKLNAGGARIYVAVADVDSLVKKDTALDGHAKANTTSVYTAGGIFPMLPEKLSTDLTSLNRGVPRNAMIVEMNISGDGNLSSSKVYPGIVKNKAKLAYNRVAAWLDRLEPVPEGVAAVPGLDENIRLQDQTAQRLKSKRREAGALQLSTLETKPEFEDGKLTALKEDEKNRAKDIIEDFMIAANGVTARFLSKNNFASVRRVVRVPKKWERIVSFAGERGFRLPQDPDSKALDRFLIKEKNSNPETFHDVSLSIIKLLGPGEYVVEVPEEPPVGHFGLAVKDYTHSTAPNRRYPDLITLRLLKAVAAGGKQPYTNEDLKYLAKQCTDREDDAKKVERRLEKSAAAMLLEKKIGAKFNAIVTGASDKGTWVRLFDPPVEGKLIKGFKGLEVGMKLRVRLLHTDAERGFIDLEKI